MSAKVFGIDFGTSTIKIYRKNEGVIFDQKNIIALCKGDVMAIGDEAFEMLGKAPDNFLVTNPVKNGVIADIANMLALLNKAFKSIIDKSGKISDADIVDGARDFRLMKREMVDAIVAMCEYNRFSKGIFGWIGFRTKWLPYKNVERVAGETKWNFWGLFKYSIDGIVNFSQAPLSIASLMGLTLTVLSFAAILFIVVRRIVFGDPVAGWASTACIILFMGGLQLLCMGIMGQYLAKTYLEVKHRPHYIVAETNDESVKLVK